MLSVQCRIIIPVYCQYYWPPVASAFRSSQAARQSFPGFRVHCALCTVLCTLSTVYCTMCTVHCALYNVQCPLCTVTSSQKHLLCNVECLFQCALCSVTYSIQCTVHQCRTVLSCLLASALHGGQEGLESILQATNKYFLCQPRSGFGETGRCLRCQTAGLQLRHE